MRWPGFRRRGGRHRISRAAPDPCGAQRAPVESAVEVPPPDTDSDAIQGGVVLGFVDGSGCRLRAGSAGEAELRHLAARLTGRARL